MTPAEPELPPLREVIARHGLSARKVLGQHFLLDQNLTGRIVRAAAPLEGACVVEVGGDPSPPSNDKTATTANATAAIPAVNQTPMGRRPRSSPSPSDAGTVARGRGATAATVVSPL